MRIETNRLILRDYTMADYAALYEILSDPETMQHYPSPFDEKRTRDWIQWNLDNYRKYGFGLWAVTLKETDEFIGDCGITLQNIDGEMLPEIGYHIHKAHWSIWRLRLNPLLGDIFFFAGISIPKATDARFAKSNSIFSSPILRWRLSI